MWTLQTQLIFVPRSATSLLGPMELLFLGGVFYYFLHFCFYEHFLQDLLPPHFAW